MERYSEAFDPDGPTLVDHNPIHRTDTDLGDRPQAPIEKRQERLKRKARKQTEHSSPGMIISPLYMYIEMVTGR